jgi:hypothetical protein
MAKVKGNKDGLITFNNVSSKKSEPLVNIQQMKDTYLFGVKVRDRETGEALSDDAYQNALDTAISILEHYLDISISPVRQFTEYKDYHLNDYVEWGYMQLNNYPVESVTSINLVYFRDDNGDPITITTIPTSWIRLENHDGTIRLVPNTRMPSQLILNQGGAFFPELLRMPNIPHAWQVVYDYGFCSGQVPVLINQAIAMLASIIILVTAGHLILGAGIAGTSISLDGLSQSIQTTQSAENSGFSAVIKDYKDLLYGKTKDDEFAILRILKYYYKGSQMNII